MDFIDRLVIPQSFEHINLLHFILVMVFSIYIPFTSLLLGGTALSLYYKWRGYKNDDKLQIRFSRDIIKTVTINKSAGIILGIIPLLTVILVYTQLLHSSESGVVKYLIFSLLFFLTAVVLIYIYRYALSFKQIFNVYESISIERSLGDSEVEKEIKQYKKGVVALSRFTGPNGFILLLAALFIFSSALTMPLFSAGKAAGNFFSAAFSLYNISKYLFLICSAFAVTGGWILFKFYYWEGGLENLSGEYSLFVRKKVVKIILIFAVLEPAFLILNLFSTPESAVSVLIFIFTLLTLLSLFFVYNLVYGFSKGINTKFIGTTFILLLTIYMFTNISDQIAFANANKKQTLKLTEKYELALSEMKSAAIDISNLNGAELFKTRCSACHYFDRKLVGPPYDETLPKYGGNVDKLVSFIRDPVKVNPAYPPMPNPGLKPAEAKAVAVYLLGELKKRQE